MDGQVVHARRGDRGNYRPILSSLCTGSAPHDIVNSLLELYPFRHLYIADINAIQGRGNHADIIRQIRNRHSSIEIWLDAAINQAEVAINWQQQGVYCVLGSESIIDINDYCTIRHALMNRFSLSLDFSRDGFLGPAELLQDTSIWPAYVIAMNLSKVGSASGPDMSLLSALQARHPHVYAAGGVRNGADLITLAASGVFGVLVASILHSGLLKSEEIDAIVNHS